MVMILFNYVHWNCKGMLVIKKQIYKIH